MAEKDITEKILLGYNDVAADVVNVLVFGGRRVVRPEDLEKLLGVARFKPELRSQQDEVHLFLMKIKIYLFLRY